MRKLGSSEVAAAGIHARLEATFPAYVRFRVTEHMVAKFAALTGDRSALHVNDAFASKSIYRQPVVHGMLPVAFLSLVEGFRADNLTCVPTAISGRFTSPVFIGDLLTLRVELAREQQSDFEFTFNYCIEKAASKATVSTGSISMAYRSGRPAPAQCSMDDRMIAGLPVDLPPSLCLTPDEIAKGRTDGFDFEISETSVGTLVAILAQGVDQTASSQSVFDQSGFHFPNLLAITLFSTLVGTRLPGNSATFLEFSARFPGEMLPTARYRLDGVVSHYSRATRILKTDVSIDASRHGEITEPVHGRVTVLVNRPHRVMPSIREMKAALNDDLGIRGKVVLVTGASRGIGETIAKLLSLYGARIIVNYNRSKDDAARIVQEIAAEGGDAIAIKADVTQLEQVRMMVAQARDRFGPINVLVNNAVRDFRPIPFLTLTWDEVQKDLDVVTKGSFHCCQEVIPQMLVVGGGKIINISSVAVDNPPPDQGKYVIAKSALVGLTRSLSVEFAQRNIQVNMVVPNFVETDLVAHVPEGFRAKIARESPMHRLGTPIEVAQAVVFLASTYSSFTTGQKIMVTGGAAPYL